MSHKHHLIEELKHEGANTRKMLERVPVEEHKEWRPHAKSYTLGRLASHVAELPSWIPFVISTSEMDFASRDYKPVTAETKEELLAMHDKNVADAIETLEKADDSVLEELWTLRNGDVVMFTQPKSHVLRSFAYSHVFHHRGQLGVYLRILDIPVPGMYGPSKDDSLAQAAHAEQPKAEEDTQVNA
jgi:uncharacterized damage-inducible protein DinB